MKSLYFHFPFCEVRCHYCDFYSIADGKARAGDRGLFEEAMKREAELVAPLVSPEIETIFYGGGTPSMTEPDAMARVMEPILAQSRLASEYEWTMEANPSSLSPEKLRAYRALGINRISMGVQAMDDELLARLGRVHSRERALEALSWIFEAGFDNVSVDLLCGVPGQTLSHLDEAMTRLTSFPITHLSCYLLTLPPHHAMFKDLPNEDGQLEHLLFIDSKMQAQGFEHYEISNFCRPGREARHNLVYWKGGSYLGLGPSAHSYNGGNRWKNVSSLHRYAQDLEKGAKPIEWTEALGPSERELEKWMLGLRLAEGVPEAWIDTPLRIARVQQLERTGLIEKHPGTPGRLRLTARGFAVSDQVVGQLA